MNDLTLYYNPTPNGHKPVLLLEELGVGYDIHYIDIQRGDQFSKTFDVISPNNRIPALVDHAPNDGIDAPVSVFESGAILYYLADKHGQFLPLDRRARIEVMQWLFWQVSGLGPMAGQAHHFIHYAPENIEYASQRYVMECARLYSVIDKRLVQSAYLADEYSIADMACWSWVMRHHRHQQDLADYPNVKRWYDTLEQRPAVARTRQIAEGYAGVASEVSDEVRQVLFTPVKK
ncbi:MAG: thiol:disulfide oxidoreductase [marine bacterium B5-7]|nr:MAG: thiol:disulfide oxidoreductase [marine bacterium B5-7]